jgi:hypothetical protein
MVNQDRIADQFPVEQQASIDLLVDLLAEPLAKLPGATGERRQTKRDAEAIYYVTFGALRAHLIRGTRPHGAEIDHLVRFCLKGAGAPRARA